MKFYEQRALDEGRDINYYNRKPPLSLHKKILMALLLLATGGITFYAFRSCNSNQAIVSRDTSNFDSGGITDIVDAGTPDTEQYNPTGMPSLSESSRGTTAPLPDPGYGHVS